MAVPTQQVVGRNERLWAAITASGILVDEIARRVGVDRKTLERWIAGRIPHPRNRRLLADVLGVHTSDLWPETDPFSKLGPRELGGVEGAYPSRSAFLSALPAEQLFADATSITMAGLSNNLLCQYYSDQRLEQLLCLGPAVTCLFLDPDGQGTAAREDEEGHQLGHLAGLTRLNIEMLQRLRDRLPTSVQDRLLLATYDQTIRFNIIIVERVRGSTAVVQPYLPHSRGVESPTLVLHPTDQANLYDTFARVLDDLRQDANPC